MGELQAAASVRWQGFGGEVKGASGKLHAPTATQAELGGPGGGTNPEELFAAAQANCFTSTLTALARARALPLDCIETHVTTRLEWTTGHGDHRLGTTTLRVGIASTAPWEQIRALVADAAEECPICRATAGSVPLQVELGPLPAG
ncbi:MAG TPA: OsmC family protein [Gaiellaceae bacterium]|jgi:organic hydroperoxide reductase OsmC/OhrA